MMIPLFWQDYTQLMMTSKADVFLLSHTDATLDDVAFNLQTGQCPAFMGVISTLCADSPCRSGQRDVHFSSASADANIA